MYKKTYFLLFWLLIAPIIFLYAQDSIKKSVYIFDVKEEIAPPVWRKMQKAFDEAEKDSVDLILIHMNTFGGQLQSADLMRTKILESKLPVYVFIDNNAASAGALISIACEKILMRKGASIGAASVVNQNGELMPDKYQSYMRSMMRSTAEARGRDPEIAEAMVGVSGSKNKYTDSAKVLTLTAQEAVELKYCDGIVEDIDEALAMFGMEHYQKKELVLSATDKAIDFLIKPYITGILIMLIIGGIYFELQTPGIGFPLLIAVVAALLYFAPHYLEGLAEHWEILLFVLGVILIAVEIFAIPGFGVAGISGIILVIAGLSLSMVNNFSFQWEFPDYTPLIKAVFIVLASSFVAIILSFVLGKQIISNPVLGKRIALQSVQDKQDGFSISDRHYAEMIGITGFTHTILRPSGKIMIEDEIFDAAAETSYINKGEKIIVTGYNNAQLMVRKFEL